MRIRYRYARSLLAGFLAVVLLFSLVPAASAAQQNSYHDPAENWKEALDRTNELDANAVVTHETFDCAYCNQARDFIVYRTPEYTRTGETALNRGVKFSDGTMLDGKQHGSLDDGTPGVDAYFTGYHWTKAVCQSCGTINANMGTYSYSYDKNVYWLFDCAANFFEDLPESVEIEQVDREYTLDAKDEKVRRYLAQRAELLGAVRLPNNAFKANAGTEVVSDIIFLQKRDHLIDIVPDWVRTRETAEGFTINHYFTAHPEMVLGRAASESTQYGHQDYTVLPIEGADLAQQLHEAVGRIHGQIPEVEVPELGDEEEPVSEAAIPADPNVKNYSYTVVDGEVYFRENSIMVKPRLNATATARVIGMVELRDCVNRLIDLQMDDADALSIQAEQKKLNTLYDAFTARFGLISNRGNELAFSDDNSYYLLSSLEVLDEDGNLQRKADMFTKRTIQPHRAVTHVDTASEALAVSISEKARVDMPYMAQLTGKTEAELAAELRGIIFRVPNETDGAGGPQYAAADEYLSGNVRQKLVEAQRAADADPMYQDNVEALRQALPKDLDASEIDLRLGATWIDQKYIQQFMYEILQTPGYLRGRIRVLYSQFTVEWSVTNKTAIPYDDVAAYMNFGTERASAYRILEDTLNLRDVRIYDTIRDGDTERRVLNQKETTLAQQKQQALKDAFKDWIWKEPQRRQELVRSYNERFNAIRPREYDGKHIVFTGMNPEITLREHQRNAIAHILYGKNTLLAHEVGAGKTFEMVAAAMESKRLGLCRKSLFAVPNHLVEQWASEFLCLYPAANILVTTKKDFEARNRKRFCAKIATGDYDAVIMGHSQFERLPGSMGRRGGGGV